MGAKCGATTYRVSWKAINGEFQEPLLASVCQNGIAPEDDSDCHARPIRPVTGLCRKLDDVEITEPGKWLRSRHNLYEGERHTKLLVQHGEPSQLNDVFNDYAHCLTNAINDIEITVETLERRRLCRIEVSRSRTR